MDEYAKTSDEATPHSIVLRDGRIEWHGAERRRLLEEFITHRTEFLAGCAPAQL
jgi:hypothetical protein